MTATAKTRARAFQGVLRSAVDSRKLAAVSPAAEALYFRLLLSVDGYGRHYGDPVDVGVRCDPRRFRSGALTREAVADMLDELERAELLERYVAEGDDYLLVTDYWQPPKADRQPVERFPAPPGSTADPERIQAGSSADPERIPRMRREKREREERGRRAHAREAPSPSPAQASQEQDARSPSEGELVEAPPIVHLSAQAEIERVAKVAGGFPSLAQDYPDLCAAFRDWVLSRREQHPDKCALAETQLRRALACVVEFAESTASVTLDRAASSGWLSLPRKRFEEDAREAAAGRSGAHKPAPWEHDPAVFDRLRKRGPKPISEAAS